MEGYVCWVGEGGGEGGKACQDMKSVRSRNERITDLAARTAWRLKIIEPVG